jgi:predicted transcriptional regulator
LELNPVAKEAVFTVKLESELRDAFVAEAAAVHQPASQLLREFMREFIRNRQEEREHDEWFRAEVEKALKDDSPGIPHEQVEKHFAKRRANALRRAGATRKAG